jgi:hypothetical protein
MTGDPRSNERFSKECKHFCELGHPWKFRETPSSRVQNSAIVVEREARGHRFYVMRLGNRLRINHEMIEHRRRDVAARAAAR